LLSDQYFTFCQFNMLNCFNSKVDLVNNVQSAVSNV